MKDKLYNSFSSDLLNRGVFPRKDLKTLETIVNLINELENGDDKISSRDYYYKGLYCIGKKNYQDAIEELKKAISLSEPDFYFEAYDALCASYSFSNQKVEAINTGLKIFKYKKDEKVIINLAYAYMRNSQFDLAHQYCELIRKDDENYLLAKAECYLREQKYREALNWIQKTNPNNYHRLRGRILFHSENYDESISQLQTKIELTDKEISNLGNSDVDINEKEKLLLSKASLYILLTLNYFKKGQELYKNEIVRNYYSAISINSSFISIDGIEYLERDYRNHFSKTEKDLIKEIIKIINSQQT